VLEIDEDAPAPGLGKYEISQTGVLSIGFDQKMKVPEVLPDGNDINLFLVNDDGKFKGKFYLYEQPGTEEIDQPARRLEGLDEDFSPLSWTVKNMTDVNLEFVLEFTSPLSVSESVEPDHLEIEFSMDKFVGENNKPLAL
jgi:hypothetical protein